MPSKTNNLIKVAARREAAESAAISKEHIELTTQLQDAIEKMSIDNERFSKPAASLSTPSKKNIVACDSTKPESDGTTLVSESSSVASLTQEIDELRQELATKRDRLEISQVEVEETRNIELMIKNVSK